MKSDKQIPIKNSIATRLLRVVFSFYLVIAISVTLGHMFMEYRHQKKSISRDLRDIQRTFEQGLSIDMWHMDQESLRSTIKGILEIPVIVGVKIQDKAGLAVAIGGIVAKDDIVGEVGQHVDLMGLNQEEFSIHRDGIYNFDVFAHQFPLSYSYEEESRRLGTATIYSNTTVVFKRVKLGFLMLIINAVLKTTALWLIFLWFSTFLLRKPLASLAAATENVSLENLDSFRMNIETSGRNELTVIEKSFNSMISNLHQSIVERESTEEALKESEKRYRTLYTDSRDAIMILTPDMEFIAGNPAVIKMFACKDEQEFTTRTVADLSPDYQPDGVASTQKAQEMIRLSLEKGSHFFEWNHRKTDGTDFPATGLLSRIERSRQQLLQATVRDITKEMILEEQLRQAQKMESIGSLAGGIAHDFNNLLYPIIGMSEMLLEDLPPNSLEHENAREIFAAGRRAADLVKQILAFSRQSKQKLMPVRIQNVLKEVLKLCRSTIPTDIEIHQDIQADCRPVKADATQIHQVAMNLITNAYHAIEGKSGKITVQLKQIKLTNNELTDSTLKQGQYIVLTVSDTGVGIKSDIVRKIFEPYFTTKEKGKGTGLGLAVAYGIVKEYQGDIKVYSEVNKGTTFDAYLPLIKKDTQVISINHVPEIETGTERILLVDDEEFVIRLQKQLLSRLGYQVTEVTSGQGALDNRWST